MLIAETRASCEALVHGDYSPKNVLVCGHDLVLLDHEVIHWGDPAFDVGFASAHLLSKAHHLPTHRILLASSVTLLWKSYQIVHLHTEHAVNLPIDWQALEVRSVQQTLGCLLARVVGRSPLEYLTPEEQDCQREAVVRLIQDVPRNVPELVERFVQEIER